MRLKLHRYDQRVLFNNPNFRKPLALQFGGANLATYGYVALYIGRSLFVAEVLK